MVVEIQGQIDKWLLQSSVILLLFKRQLNLKWYFQLGFIFTKNQLVNFLKHVEKWTDNNFVDYFEDGIKLEIVNDSLLFLEKLKTNL